MEGITIREAKKADCAEIRRLIKELAEFEKMPEKAKITVEDLETDGFDTRHPLFHCYVAEVSSGPEEDAVVPDKDEKDGDFGLEDTVAKSRMLIAYALCYFSYSTWTGKAMFLEDLYVSPDYRGTGVGSRLFDRVAKKAYECGCSRLDFVVLNWNSAQEFYKRKGATDLTEQEGWHYYRLEYGNMKKLLFKADKGECQETDDTASQDLGVVGDVHLSTGTLNGTEKEDQIGLASRN